MLHFQQHSSKGQNGIYHFHSYVQFHQHLQLNLTWKLKRLIIRTESLLHHSISVRAVNTCIVLQFSIPLTQNLKPDIRYIDVDYSNTNLSFQRHLELISCAVRRLAIRAHDIFKFPKSYRIEGICMSWGSFFGTGGPGCLKFLHLLSDKIANTPIIAMRGTPTPILTPLLPYSYLIHSMVALIEVNCCA